MTRLVPFYADEKTADTLLAVARANRAQTLDGQVVSTGASEATTQFQNTCQFKLTTNWKQVGDTTKNFIASGEKFVPLPVGAEKRSTPTTIYSYGDRPTSGRDSIIVATRRANQWVLLPTGTASEGVSVNQKIRLVQPKELFPACEYDSLQSVYDAALEYSDDGGAWIPLWFFNIVRREVFTFPVISAPHKYWRVNLKGFAKPGVQNDPTADRGFYTFGRLWEALFWIYRNVTSAKTVNNVEYTFTADVANWQVNSGEPLAVSLSLYPAVAGELFYKPSTGDWQSLGFFSGTTQIILPAKALQITQDTSTGQEKYNKSFQFKVEKDDTVYGNLSVQRPGYTLSPAGANTFSVTDNPVVFKNGNQTITAKVTSTLQSGEMQVSVLITADPPVLGGRLLYCPQNGTWTDKTEIYQSAAVTIPADDLQDEGNTYFDFVIQKNNTDVIGVRVPRPVYPIDTDAAEVAMPPPRPDANTGHLFFDSKPISRSTQNHRYWMLTFDEPETVTQVRLDAECHNEHYIICPGGRTASKQDISFIYSFDLTSEKWTAATFPELQQPMFNMDAKVVELADGTHQLVILSGQIAKGFSNIIQGYNFEKNYIQNAVDTGNGGLNFAGRPALTGDPMVRYGFAVKYPEGENDFSRSLIIAGGSEKSCYIRGTTSAIDSVLFFIKGSTLDIGMPYETQTLNNTLSNVGNTGLPYGAFDYTTQSSNAGAVGTRLKNMAAYTRHQNLPVRGLLRRRPKGSTSSSSSSTPVVDFILIGGFNQVGREEYNKRVVSGIFNSPTASAANSGNYSMLAANVHFSANNANHFLLYPDCDVVLGDCCAEYIYEQNGFGIVTRDEVICFGGRANESDIAFAHKNPAVLEFDFQTNAALWKYQKYPPMPHPRWSAASVVIRDLVRKGEREACHRIFIIGGRNKDGFVPEIDVFNLRYNQWETDWKGLDQGELENIPPSLGGNGATIIINSGGGSSGVQSVKAGQGIVVTGDSKNPVIASTGFIWG